MSETIAESIVRFDGDADEDNMIHRRALVNDITETAVKINKRPLKEFFSRNFRIPDYQRGYQWEEDNWQDLWDEITNMFAANTTQEDGRINDVFFGSMFFAERDGDDLGEDIPMEVYDVIDGQQRITTLTILFKIMIERLEQCTDHDLSVDPTEDLSNLKNLIYQETGMGVSAESSIVLNRHHWEFFSALISEDDNNLIEDLLGRERVHGNTKDDAIRVREYLESLNVDKNQYLRQLRGSVESSETDSHPNLLDSEYSDVDAFGEDELTSDSELGDGLLGNKVKLSDDNARLVSAYNFFDDLLSDRLDGYDPQQEAYALVNLKNYILYSFRVGYFEVQEDQPRLLMNIFEILNNRGMELKEADVMRTRIVDCLRSSADRDEYVDRWEDIIEQFGNERIIDYLRTYFVANGAATARGKLKNHLLEAFSRNQSNGDQKLESRLTDTSSAEAFIDSLNEYAEYYGDITDIDNRGISLPDADDEVEDRCNRILSRLRSANTSIWEPLVLGVYHDIAEDSPGRSSELVELLEAIESMAIRKFAVMDTQTRDRLYAETIEAYHEDGLDAELAETLTSIETKDQNAVGENLVVELCRADWPKQWAKPVLRKIASEKFDSDDDRLVRRDLNTDDSVVHLEHVFPQTPIGDGEDKYQWLRQFFEIDPDAEVEPDAEPDSVEELVTELIQAENTEVLEDIADEYIYDIGNLLLLRSEENISIGNESFHRKVVQYYATDGFEELATNEDVCDRVLSPVSDKLSRVSELRQIDTEESWEEAAADHDLDVDSHEEYQEHVEAEISALEDRLGTEWTHETMTDHRAHLIEQLCDLIELEDEFTDVDIQKKSEETMTDRDQRIAINYRRTL